MWSACAKMTSIRSSSARRSCGRTIPAPHCRRCFSDDFVAPINAIPPTRLMSIERALKLALPPEQADSAERFFTALAGAAGRDLPLTNIYFDTPSLALAHEKIALR